MDKPEKNLSYYEHMEQRGINRRDFLKFATLAAATIGLEYSAAGKVVEALETKERVPVLWLHFQECTGCTESFIRSAHPLPATLLFDHISLDYSETLMAPSGFNAEKSRKDTMEKYKGKYLLVVEGAIPTKDGGVYCTIGGHSAIDILKETAEGAAAIITFGSCSSFGGVQAAYPNPTGSEPVHKIIKNKPIIKVPGCPPIGEVMTGVIVHFITFGAIPQLDNQGRPKEFYGKRVHDSCYRRPYFDAGLFAEEFDDNNAKKGYCLYKVGCRGPVTYNACGTMGWNEGVGFPIKSGNPCIGCSEDAFWDNGPFLERLTNIQQTGIESTADDIGKIVTGVTVGAVVTHGIVTNIAKRKEIKESLERANLNTQNIDESKK